MQLNTPEEARAFLRLCLNPGYGISRTAGKLAKIMPPALRDQVEEYAPHLAELRAAVEEAEAEAAAARANHAEALAAWIEQEATDPAPDEQTELTEPAPEWCGQCDAPGARFIDVPGGVGGRGLLAPCPKCHPDPDGFYQRAREQRNRIDALNGPPATTRAHAIMRQIKDHVDSGRPFAELEITP